MFDWDKDQESLVATPTDRMADTETASAKFAALRGKIGLALLGASLMLGWAYEKDVLPQFRGASALGLASFEAFVPTNTYAALPEGLVAYDAAKAQRFLRDLRSVDLATLTVYTARTESDLAHATPAMAPFYKDVQALLSAEMARRAANAS